MLKILLRFAVVVVSFPLAWVVARWSSQSTLSPLASGGYEGTPATVVIVPIVLIVTFVFSIIIGNLAINRYYRRNN
jgi:hypothetical protein